MSVIAGTSSILNMEEERYVCVVRSDANSTHFQNHHLPLEPIPLYRGIFGKQTFWLTK